MKHILPPFPIEPILTTKQLERLTNIFDNAGQVYLGAMVITPLLGDTIDEQRITVILSGSVATIVAWSLSLLLTRRLEK